MTDENLSAWEADRDHLRDEMYANITKRKIRKIAFLHDGKLMVAEVGQPNPYNGVPVRVIYEDAARGCFLICAGTVTIAPETSLVEEA
jgi:hypothetical protein